MNSWYIAIPKARAETIRAKLKEGRLTQGEVADLLAMSRVAVNQAEKRALKKLGVK
jgi:DNA-binding CsgD family transcriptional regulator